MYYEHQDKNNLGENNYVFYEMGQNTKLTTTYYDCCEIYNCMLVSAFVLAATLNKARTKIDPIKSYYASFLAPQLDQVG